MASPWDVNMKMNKFTHFVLLAFLIGTIIMQLVYSFLKYGGLVGCLFCDHNLPIPLTVTAFQQHNVIKQRAQVWDSHFREVFLNRKLQKENFQGCKYQEKTLAKNLKRIEGYQKKFNVSKHILNYLGLDNISFDARREINTKEMFQHPGFPVKIAIVSAASANHYFGALAFVKNIKATLFDETFNKNGDIMFSLTFFDIGLNRSQRERIRHVCECDFRQFPADLFPKHISVPQTYAWKPVVIQLMLKQNEYVLWLDTSVRFHETNMTSFLIQASEVGIQLRNGYGKIKERTALQTLQFLDEQNSCMLQSPETAAGVILIRRQFVVLKYIMLPWVSCALSHGCIVFKNSEKYINCKQRNGGFDFSRCHRFEQSVLGIILTRIFRFMKNLVYGDFDNILSIDRSNKPFQVHGNLS